LSLAANPAALQAGEAWIRRLRDERDQATAALMDAGVAAAVAERALNEARAVWEESRREKLVIGKHEESWRAERAREADRRAQAEADDRPPRK
jgi:hypothetical protein